MSSSSRNSRGQQCPIVFTSSRWRGTFLVEGPTGQPRPATPRTENRSGALQPCNSNGELSEAQWFAQQLEDPANRDRQVEPDDWLEWAATFG